MAVFLQGSAISTIVDGSRFAKSQSMATDNAVGNILEDMSMFSSGVQTSTDSAASLLPDVNAVNRSFRS